MSEAAVAYVSLAISADGAGKEIEKALGNNSKGFDKSGRSIGDNLISGIGKTLKAGAIAVGATAAAGLGTALVKGFQRLNALDQATAKLNGLGHSAETVERIMDNALASVRGTAFGMGDAAQVAANAVAAGIKPGTDLERTLKAVADAATIAGVDMGSMGAIFNKVAASNKVQMDVINQLHDAGVPALALLADQMGVTAEEASKMASAGKIDFETFQAAMETGMGGAALESGNTFSGAMDNVLAALGRVGEGLLSGIFPQMTEGFKGVIEWLGPFEEGAKKVGEAIGGLLDLVINGNFSESLRNAFGWEEDSEIVGFLFDLREGLIEAFNAAVKFGGDTFSWIKDNLTWLGPLAVGLGVAATAYTVVSTSIAAYKAIVDIAKAAQLAWNASLLSNPIMLVVTALVALVAGLVWFFTQTELGQQVWANITTAIQNAIGWIGDAFNWLWTSVIQPVGQWISDAVTAVGDAVTWVWESLIKPPLDAIGAAFQWLYDNMIYPSMTAAMIVFGLLAAAFEFLWVNAIQPILAWIGQGFQWLWDNAIGPVVGWIQTALQVLGAVATWLWESAISPALDAIGGALTWLWESVVNYVVTSIQNAFTVLGAVFTWLYANAVKPTLDAVGAAFQWVYGSVIRPTVDFIRNAIQTVGSTVQSVFGGIAGFVGAAFQSVLGVVKGPINALISMINGIIGGLNSISVTIPDWVPIVGGQTFGLSIPTIPQLADGGIVSARRGGILANIGEGRYDEAVIPLGGQQFNQLADALAERGAVSPDGMEITGRLEIGGDGLARIVDGRIVRATRSGSAGAVSSRYGNR